MMAPQGLRRGRVPRGVWLARVSRAAWCREKQRRAAHLRQVLPRLAELVASLVPAGAVVADVAGGDGQLSLLLRDAGLRPLLIDPCHEGGAPAVLAGIELRPRRLRASDVGAAALFVGVHPCGATPTLARIRSKPVVLLPCCNWYWWVRGRWQHRPVGQVCLGRAGGIRADVLISVPSV